jgi:hypothetical protein
MMVLRLCKLLRWAVHTRLGLTDFRSNRFEPDFSDQQDWVT